MKNIGLPLLISSGAALVLLAIRYLGVRRTTIQAKWSSRARLTVLALLVAVISIGAVLTYQQYRNPKKPVLNIKSQNLRPVEEQKNKDLSEYEIIGKNVTKASARLEIITKERDKTKLIALNDYLYEKYKGEAKVFFIDYFDDKEVALTYFSKQADPSTSKAEKNDLYKHYIALMVDSPQLKMKKLYLQGKPAQELKNY